MLRSLNTLTRSRHTLGYVRSFSSTKIAKEDYDVVVVGTFFINHHITTETKELCHHRCYADFKFYCLRLLLTKTHHIISSYF